MALFSYTSTEYELALNDSNQIVMRLLSTGDAVVKPGAARDIAVLRPREERL